MLIRIRLIIIPRRRRVFGRLIMFTGKIRATTPVDSGAVKGVVIFCIVFCIIIQFSVFLFPANIR